MPPIINQIMQEENYIPEVTEVNLAPYFEAAQKAEKEEKEEQRKELLFPNLHARVEMALKDFHS